MDEAFFFGAEAEISRSASCSAGGEAYSIRSSSIGGSSNEGRVGSDSSSSPLSTTSLIDFSVLDKPSKTAARNSLKLELANIEHGLSATTSRESLLDELLGDIRRSCGTSLASTPTTMVSLSEGEQENVFECKLRRSEAELGSLGQWSQTQQLVGVEKDDLGGLVLGEC